MLSVFVYTCRRLIDLSLIAGTEGYFQCGWNWIDFVIVISALAVTITGAKGGVFRAIRAIRILRPLRAIQRSPGMRMTVAALLGSVPAICTVRLLLFFEPFSSVSALPLMLRTDQINRWRAASCSSAPSLRSFSCNYLKVQCMLALRGMCGTLNIVGGSRWSGYLHLK